MRYGANKNIKMELTGYSYNFVEGNKKNKISQVYIEIDVINHWMSQ